MAHGPMSGHQRDCQRSIVKDNSRCIVFNGAYMNAYSTSLNSSQLTEIDSSTLYAKRRSIVAQRIGVCGIAIIPTAPEHARNRDSNFLYRHDSYFYYLTGFTEPNAWLIIQGDGQCTLFCLPKDQEREIWDGYRLGPEAAPDVLGMHQAFSFKELHNKLPALIDGADVLWYPFATHVGLEVEISSILNKVRSRSRFGSLCPNQQVDLCSLLDEMRLFKDEHEQATMRAASKISAAAHIRAMQLCARMLFSGKEVREFHLEAELLHEFRRHGSQYPAYSSIVAAGANACVLHYHADISLIRSGDLVLIDAGCELNSYASDITRTFPANGKFTGAQRALYDLVLASQDAALSATVNGARFTDPHEASVKVLSQGMLDLGLLDKKQVGSVEDVIESRAYFKFYMHRTSHWLGMDVHDCGDYNEPTEVGNTNQRIDDLTGQVIINRPSRILKPGMVLTIEPGIYVRPSHDVPANFHNIGIRIEDDVIITTSGHEIITRAAPVKPEEIEALMNS